WPSRTTATSPPPPIGGSVSSTGSSTVHGGRRSEVHAMTLDPCETRVDILPKWTDQNGHMNVAYYVLAFDRATDTLYNELGIGWSYLDRTGRSLFTLAMNVDYLGE